MRCKTCDYPLWNLPARKCPECGTDFKASDFHFVPNSIRFCCPHCEQHYYGTTEHGHLIPRTFNCVQCGQRIDMDEMLLRPAEGVAETHTAADVMPWLQRKHFGWLKGWLRTIGMAMIAPHKLMRAVPHEGGLGEACLFALLTNALYIALGIGLPLGGIGLVMALNRDRGALGMFGAAGGAVLGGTIGTIVVASLWALLAHGLLRISGGTARGLGRTTQAMYYSSGANALLAIPCVGAYCGIYFLWVWWFVSAIIMVKEGQKVSGLRAAMCVGAGPALAVASFGAVILLLIFAARSNIAGLGSAPPGSYAPVREAQVIGAGILSHASTNNGQGPAHAIELVASGAVAAGNFAMWQTGHDEVNVPLPAAGISLDAFQYLPPNRMRMTANAVAQSHSPNVIAHRMGDVVLTYHGIDLRNADPRLWIAVLTPDPDQPSAGPQTLAAVKVSVDGTAAILAQPITAELKAQNAIRAVYSLPPLPDPSTVLNGAPAVAGSPTIQPSP